MKSNSIERVSQHALTRSYVDIRRLLNPEIS